MLPFGSIQQYHASLLNGSTSCEAMVTTCLKKTTEKKHLNAFLRLYSDEALMRARALDRQRSSGQIMGKLHGVVIALKDVICYKDHPVTAASRILENYTAIYNSTVVERLIEEEAIIIGHTNCDEFAMGSTNENSAFGKVLNAIDESRVPGGSSGGSAVALQSGMCMISLGTDTGGSVRQPADFCGIIGFKPSYGVISRYGIIAYASSFDQVGIFANYIEDVAAVLEVIEGPDSFDSTTYPLEKHQYKTTLTADKQFKIGYFKDAFESPALDPEMADAFSGFVTTLKNDGNTIEPVNFDFLDYIVPTYYILTTAEASSNLSRYDGIRYGYREPGDQNNLTELYSYSRSSGFGKEVKRRIMLGTFVLSAGYYDAYFTKAQQVRQILVDKIKLIFKDFDAIILPTVPSPAFRVGEITKDPISMYMADIFTVFANLTGLPATSIPLFWHKSGLPFGLQIMTYQFCELSLLQLSSQWMARYRNSQR
ncbi:MAG TPA: Asp-tRNA(Asn)/Glu-tRNA(Gln) amidotransferase subunit GatA [Flavitalea sp.]|nr:Asp-tRNA(Asn)/Glu-tRNA(Gln) amidotransferase subunit GatA [Flavitalea sp.]